jgi:hypothetical protein
MTGRGLVMPFVAGLVVAFCVPLGSFWLHVGLVLLISLLAGVAIGRRLAVYVVLRTLFALGALFVLIAPFVFRVEHAAGTERLVVAAWSLVTALAAGATSALGVGLRQRLL